MKKFCTLLLALAAITTTARAEEIPFRVDLDDASRVTISVDDDVKTGLVNGLNVFNVNAPTTVTVTANEGARLVSVREVDGSWSDELPIHAENGVQFCYINLYSDYGSTYYVTTEEAEVSRSATATIDVDNAAAVRVVRVSDDAVLDLSDGDNAYKFNPATENALKITPVDKPLYKVSLNGMALTSANGYSYEVTIADKDRLVIEANYPDVDCSVKFNLTGDDAAGFIQEVDVEGKPVFNWMDDNFTVKSGSTLEFKGNTNEYEVLSFKVNGTTQSFFNPFGFVVDTDVVIDIEVRKYATFKMTVNVDDPANVHVYRGYSYNGDELTLGAGPNSVEINRNTPIISLVPAEGRYIKSVTVDGYEYPADELHVAPVMVGSLADGSVLTVTTGVIDRNLQGGIYIYNLGAADGYFKMLRSDRTEVAGLAEGYNTFLFYEGDNPFEIQTGAPIDAYVYMGADPLEPKFPGSRDYNVYMVDKEVVKVFFGDKPSAYTVSFTAPADAAVSVIRDGLTPVANWQEGFKVLQNTAVVVSATSDRKYDVTVDGREQGTITTAAPLNLEITADTYISLVEVESGIDTIDSDISGNSLPIHNLQGMPVGTDLSTLPAGLYIRAGRKIIVR